MIGPPQLERSATFTRPADTTAYTAGDLVANSTTAGSVALMSWVIPDGGFFLRRVKLTKSNGGAITNAQFRLWLTTDSAITFTNGDNGALSIASSTLSAADVLACVDITVDCALTGAQDSGWATFDDGLHPLFASSWANGVGTIYGFLEARAAYTPGNAEVFTVYLRGNKI